MPSLDSYYFTDIFIFVYTDFCYFFYFTVTLRPITVFIFSKYTNKQEHIILLN